MKNGEDSVGNEADDDDDDEEEVEDVDDGRGLFDLGEDYLVDSGRSSSEVGQTPSFGLGASRNDDASLRFFKRVLTGRKKIDPPGKRERASDRKGKRKRKK